MGYITELKNKGLVLNSREKGKFLENMDGAREYINIGNQAAHLLFLDEKRKSQGSDSDMHFLKYNTVPFNGMIISELACKIARFNPSRRLFQFFKDELLDDEIKYFQRQLKGSKKEAIETSIKKMREILPFEQSHESLKKKTLTNICSALVFEYNNRDDYWSNILKLSSDYGELRGRGQCEAINIGIYQYLMLEVEKEYSDNIIKTWGDNFRKAHKLDKIKGELFKSIGGEIMASGR